MIRNKILFALLGLTVTVMSCSDEETEPKIDTQLQQVGEAIQQGIKVTLYADEPLFVGYNEITAQIEMEDGTALSGQAQAVALMDMMTKQHTCPLEYPEGNTVKEGLLRFSAVFVMPSGEMGTWVVNITTGETEISVPVTVVQPEQKRLVSFVSSVETGEVSYFVCLLEPREPQVGQNDLKLVVYTKKSMMEWPAAEGLEIEMTPWMTSMDHGSPNNVNPVHEGKGHYAGKVNFTMTGDWQIRLKMEKEGVVCGEPFFDLYF